MKRRHLVSVMLILAGILLAFLAAKQVSVWDSRIPGSDLDFML